MTDRTLAGICQSEGPRGETICMLPLGHEGPCGWETTGTRPMTQHTRNCPAYGNYQPPYEECTCGFEDARGERT